VLVSELMLQQTQVERVIPRFELFISRFPDLESLAAADEEEVLEMWAGLGYYRRARLLHRLAREVVVGVGTLPRSAVELEALPGVGPYTAAAVASLAHGEAAPVLDGNVMRVASRVLALDDNPRSATGRRTVVAWVADLMQGQPPGEINEGLMELGATVCTPSSPGCLDCPLREGCQAHGDGRPASYPPPRRCRAIEDHRWVAACVVRADGAWRLHRIEDGPILRGLWLPPLADLEDGVDPVGRARVLANLPHSDAAMGGTIHHGITHRRIRVTPVRLDADEAQAGVGEGVRWWRPGEPLPATSSLLAKLVTALDAPCLPFALDG
jgi:A/G-specific adenine glycosylase